MLDFRRSHQLLASSHVGERDKALLRGVMVGGVWNGFLLGKMRGEAVPCRFCGGADGDGHLFWDCPYSLLNEIRENMRKDKSQWPGCLLWHGWLLLSGVNGESPWAVTADDAAVKMLESALGVYSSDIFQGWDVPQSVDWDSAADRMPPHPDVWTDGSLLRDEVSGSAFPGSGVYARLGPILRVLGDWEAPVGMLLPIGCLGTLMFGLMVVLFVTIFLALHLLGLGSMLACMLTLGQTVVGGILMILVLLRMAWLHLVEASALFLGSCRLFRGLSSGVSFWLCRLPGLFI